MEFYILAKLTNKQKNKYYNNSLISIHSLITTCNTSKHASIKYDNDINDKESSFFGHLTNLK